MSNCISDKNVNISWRNSLIIRVIMLCVVLVLCLFGSVWGIAIYFFDEIEDEMNARTSEAIEILQDLREESPGSDLAVLLESPRFNKPDMNVTLPASDESQEETFGYEVTKDGHIMFKARRLVKDVLVEVSLDMTFQTEILRAFKNKYVGPLILVFILTLGFMVFFIIKLLQPLKDLSESCSNITKGELKNVVVRKGSGEVMALEQTFNSMVEALKEKDVVETKLRQAQRLSAIGNLAAGVAHDIRNPLNAIKLLSSHTMDILGDTKEAELASKQLRTIRNEVDQLENIVSGFLSLAKERELQTEPSRIDGLLEECVRLISKDAESRGIKIIEELRAGEIVLMLDPKQWTRAILNVLINAMEACPKGGRVRLFSRLTDIDCEMEIRDDGPGLSEDAVEHAFDPYFTTKSTGTGLGLSITRGIIEEHHGTIELASSAGQGCQVLITVPLKVESE